MSHILLFPKIYNLAVCHTIKANQQKSIPCYPTINSQWFLERVENVNIKHYIKHSSPWQWYGYYFDSANFWANFICRSLSMFKYDKYITNSLILTQYINKTYQHKNKCLLLTTRFPKRRWRKHKSNTPVTQSPRKSLNLGSRAYHLHYCCAQQNYLLSNILRFVHEFFFVRIFNVMQLILVKLSGILCINI
jgi:hypothetical protein